MLTHLHLETLKPCADVDIRADRHSVQIESKMVFFRDPERSVLDVREHRKRGKAPFAGRYGLNVDRS